ncbi:phosphodiesterase [Marinobacter sp. HL-58]|uniref:EAL domain-containing protein n=1 Tax=Marinobacter sp. HL-58 TaxID=1479237 RepID=UPI00055C0691|nr:phosphodiesterase [Marinobacter sp. HL-58]KPQ01640.1 MAG: diguanylate cyclase/phosphodiesterase [Marinobacter sp. HL-58]
MQDCLSQELNRLLLKEDITTLLQPIVNIDKKSVFGFEALSRGPSDSPLHTAPMLFETAERCGQTLELETLCLRTAARHWSGHGTPLKLFVNISPAKLMPPEFNPTQLQELLLANGLKASDIVIELSERYPTADPSELLKTLVWLKAEGFLIAIDDLGSGYSGLKLWSELKPDFVKIDRHFIRDIQDDLIKREFLRSVVDLADRLGCKLIAEGIETEAEFRVVSDLGIALVQGFLFGRPKAVATACLDSLNVQTSRTPKLHQREKDTAGLLCRYIEPVTSESTLQHAWERLQSEPDVFALPVVDDGRPLGLIHKWRVLETFSTPYGRALYERLPVTQMHSPDALVVDYEVPLNEVSERLINDDAHYLKQHFIIVRDGKYAGLGATRSLLKHITERKIENARYANPLTLLPGNVPIQQALVARTQEKRPFSLVYFDINMFKPLNDVLGYRVGDQVILLLSELLSTTFHARDEFVGHIGGDDFVVISSSPSVIASAGMVQTLFVEQSRRFYNDIALKRGYVESEDRNGQVNSFPLVSLAAGIVEVAADANLTADQLSDLASYAKKRAKASPDFSFVSLAGSRSVKPLLA